jgi:hypothetical protein
MLGFAVQAAKIRRAKRASGPAFVFDRSAYMVKFPSALA